MPVFKPDFGEGLKLDTKEALLPASPLKNGGILDSQITRAVALGSYFLSGCMAINVSQLLGSPLYLVNRDWYNAWIAFTKQSFGLLTMVMTQCWAPTIMRISGDKSVRGQLLQTTDGRLLCNFPERLFLICNHQIYTDWLYLWWIAYTNGMHGRIYIILKESLKRIPVIGWGMQLFQFIFLKRNWEKDKPNLAKNLQKLNEKSVPMWLMMFPEGTNLAPSTRESSKRWADKNGIPDMQHQLLPRSTGLQFCLQQMRGTVDYIYDCTIAYEGVPHGQYAQDIFTLKASYFQGRAPKSVNMYWRRFRISTIPIDDSKAFEIWLRARWMEKDMLIDQYLRTGRFPADTGVEKGPDGHLRRGAGYIETEVKTNYLYEFLQCFAPLGLLALVLYSFYGALPKNFIKSLKKQAIQKKAVISKLGNFQPNKVIGNQMKLLTGAMPQVFSKIPKGRIPTIQAKKPALKAPQRKLLTAPGSKIANTQATGPQKPVVRMPIIKKAPVKTTPLKNQVSVAKKPQKAALAVQKPTIRQQPKITPRPPAVKPTSSAAPKLQVSKQKATTAPKPPQQGGLTPQNAAPKPQAQANPSPSRVPNGKQVNTPVQKKVQPKLQAVKQPSQISLSIKKPTTTTPKKNLEVNKTAGVSVVNNRTPSQAKPGLKQATSSAGPKKLGTNSSQTSKKVGVKP
ncbi:MAG: hypothetical protein M1834_007576 [Cirrosporium novae-zelandiae]|nr:MAG: hypothetical protein M1834_007576 [Cirrosporium novae-zelandiae]